MVTVSLILMVAAFVLFILATIGIPGVPGRFNLVAGGLALWVLAVILTGLKM